MGGFWWPGVAFGRGIMEALGRITGYEQADDARAWRAWWADVGDAVTLIPDPPLVSLPRRE